ncbi:MAG TPA: hypothetical protein VGN14_12625 [Candidatus Elarobacter sp.]|jgi:hypothetical protein
MPAIHWPRVAAAALIFTGALCVRASADETAPAATVNAGICPVLDAMLSEPLSSRGSRPGEIFHFTASANGATLNGVGVVNFVRGARPGGKPGQIGLEARYLQNADGSHVPAMIAPLHDMASVRDGKSRNAPFVLSAMSFAKGSGFHVASGVIAIYNLLHSGSQAVLPAGTPLRLVLGDDYLTGACRLD